MMVNSALAARIREYSTLSVSARSAYKNWLPAWEIVLPLFNVT